MNVQLIASETVKEYLKRAIFGADQKIDKWVDAMPTIDAIPVEWLRKWPKDLREGAYVRDILMDWQKEQEAR